MKKRKLIFDIITTTAMYALLLVFVAPFVLVIYNSVKPTKEFLENPLALPSVFNFNNFLVAYDKMKFMSGLLNTVFITSVSVILITFLTAMTAHAMVRNKWKINQILFISMIASMIIPFQAIMIPLVKIYGSIGLLNNKFTLIYMYIGFGTSFAVFIYHGFIKSIPKELEEAAFIDGCGKVKSFFLVVFPLLKPTTFTVAILDILWIWNDFLLPSLILIKPNQRTLPLSTFYFFGTYTVDYGLLMAGLLMTILPVIIIYVFMQKYIIEGVMQGSIK